MYSSQGDKLVKITGNRFWLKMKNLELSVISISEQTLEAVKIQITDEGQRRWPPEFPLKGRGLGLTSVSWVLLCDSALDFHQDVNAMNHLYTQVNLKWEEGPLPVSPGTQTAGDAICIPTLHPRAGQVRGLKVTFHKMFAQSVCALPFCHYFWSHGMMTSWSAGHREHHGRMQKRRSQY